MRVVTQKREHRRAVRVIRAAVVALVSLWALYVVAINVFLSTSLFERVIDGDPDTIDIHYRRGWSVIPGRIHARSLSIRGRDSNVEWILKLDRADFDMSFAALFSKRFDVSRVHGTGITFRLRSRLDAPPKTPEEVADLPAIDGLPPWSVRPPPQDSPDVWNDSAYHLWTAHLERVVADDVREVWIDRGHFEGDARIDGRFYFKPLRKVDVGPAVVTIRSGRVDRFAEDVTGKSDVTIAPFDPRTAKTADMLHALTARADLHGRCPDLGAFDRRVAGPLEIRTFLLDVRKGVVSDGTHVDVALPAATAADDGHRATAAVVVTGDVTGGTMSSRIAATSLVVAHDGKTMASAPRPIAFLDARALDLADPLRDLHAVVDLADASLPDASVLDGYIPKDTPVEILGGDAHGDVHLEAWLGEKRAAGRWSLRANDLDLRFAKLRVHGESATEGSFAAFHWDTQRLTDANVRLDVTKGALAAKKPLVEVSGLHADAHGGDVDLRDPLKQLDVHVKIPDGSIVAPELLSEYLPQGSEMRIRGGQGRFGMSMDLEIVDHVAKGTASLRSKHLGFSFREFALTADVRANAEVHDWRWERGDLALDHASVDVSNVVLAKNGRPGFEVRRITVAAKSPRFDLTDPLGSISFRAEIAAASVRDPAMINAFLPKDAKLRLDADTGVFAAIANARVEKHVARADLAASAAGMGITDGKARVVGDMTVQAVVGDWDLAKSTLAVHGAHLALSNVKGRLSPGKGVELSAKRIDVLATAPRLAIGKPTLRGLDAELHIDGAELPDARALGALLPEKSVLRIESGSARVSANVKISSSTRSAKGGIEVALSRAGVALDETHLAGDFLVGVNVAGWNPDESVLDLGGSHVAMRRVSVTGASTPATDWTGDLTFDQASLSFVPRPVIDAGFRLEARDASPLFAIVFRNDIPHALAGLVSMDHLSASGRVTVDPDGIFLDELDARGGNVRAHGSYASEHDERRGAFVVEKGSLAVGVRVGSDVSVRFFGLRGWLDDERKEVERVRAKAKTTR